MAFVYHAFDKRGVGIRRIDGAFPLVVAGDEEGGVEVVCFEDVEESASVEVGPVVIGEGDGVGEGAVVDVGGVGDVAELGPHISHCGGPGRCGV